MGGVGLLEANADDVMGVAGPEDEWWLSWAMVQMGEEGGVEKKPNTPYCASLAWMVIVAGHSRRS